MRFLIFQSLRELVHRVESMLHQSHMIDRRTLQVCYHVIQKTTSCLDNLYYTHILEPKLRSIKEQEHISKTILWTIYHFYLTEKDRTDPWKDSLIPLYQTVS